MQGRSISVGTSAGITVGRIIVALVVMALSMLWYTSPAEAEEFDPTNAEELIGAINDANANDEADTINLVEGATYTLTEVDNTTFDPSGLPEVTTAIEINGNGATIERSGEEGTPPFNLFHISGFGDGADGDLTLRDLTLRGGATSEFRSGGAIYNNGANLTVVGSTLSGNSAGLGGAVFSSTDSYSTEDSTPPESRTTIINSTIANNTAGGGGGVYNISGYTEIRYSTITDNSAQTAGGGVLSFGDSVTGTRITSSIVVGNTSAGAPDDVSTVENRPYESGGYNLVGAGNRAGDFDEPTDQSGVSVEEVFGTDSPQLAENGGPTQTIALEEGSEAIDQGNAPDLTTDQRGEPRPVDLLSISNAEGGDGSDVGAFELQGILIPEASVSPDSLDFQTQRVGTSSEAQSVTLSNTGNAPINISDVSTNGDEFSVDSEDCTGAPVAAGDECTISVSFTPDSTGEKNATLEVQTNAQEEPLTVSLTGVGESAPEPPDPPNPPDNPNACTITGTPGNDILRGTSGRDVICGGGGDDLIYGLGGNDLLRGGPGDDFLVGGPGNDKIVGGGGKDRINGGPGNDALRGGPGNDILRGAVGRDTLVGGGGNDVLIGGPGQNRLIGGPGKNVLRP